MLEICKSKSTINGNKQLKQMSRYAIVNLGTSPSL